jgi:hypothetical protein
MGEIMGCEENLLTVYIPSDISNSQNDKTALFSD